MSDHTSSTERDPTIADLYPHFNEAQRVEAEENLERYLELALRIYERIQGDPEAASPRGLDAFKRKSYDE